MQTVFFANTRAAACGVHVAGLNLWRILEKSNELQFLYIEPETLEHLRSALGEFRCRNVLVNYMPMMMPWYSPRALPGIKQVALLSHGQGLPGFDAYLIPDPSAARTGNRWQIGRPLPAVTRKPKVQHQNPVIGSAGFLLPHKRYPWVLRQIINAFPSPVVRFHIGRADYAPYDLPDIAKCLHMAKECGVQLEISTGFLSPDALADWLADNDLNVYLYSGGPGAPAPAMGPDPALSARRPIAVCKDDSGLAMFHHLTPSVCIEDNDLPTILENGTAPLEPLYERFSDERVLSDVENCLNHYVH